jgi:hypothetical protein
MGVGLELFAKRANGSEVPVEISLSPVHTKEGCFVAAAVRDVTYQQERFRLLVEGVREYALYMLDPEGYVVSWNAGAENIRAIQKPKRLGCMSRASTAPKTYPPAFLGQYYSGLPSEVITSKRDGDSARTARASGPPL